MQNEYDIKTIMEEIEQDLIVRMKRTLWSHKEDEKTKGFDWPQWQALKIKQFEDYKNANKEIFDEKTKGLNRYIYKHIKDQFKEGASRTNKEAIKSGFIKKEDSQLGGSFFGLNHRKLDALIKSTKEDMKDVKYATLRMANDQYRQIIYKAQVYANTGAGTVKQAIDMATKDFLAKGFNCIEYKDGSRHNIADYCDMAIRTANKRANLMGEGEMRKKLGNPLVYISKHGGACDKCTPWEGRVYIDDVWSGGKAEDGQYPLLSTAIAGGLFHPRCRHGVSTYYEGINDEPEDVTKAKHNDDKNDKYTQYLQQRQKQYERLALGSLLPENIVNYENNAKELQNQIDSSKIEEWKNLNTIDEAKEYVYNNYQDSDIDKITNIDNINETFKTLYQLQNKYSLKTPIFIRNGKLKDASASANYKGINIDISTFNNSNLRKIVGYDFKNSKLEFIKKIEDYKQKGGKISKLPSRTREYYKKYKEQVKYENLTVSSLYDKTEQIKATVEHEYGHILADQYFGQINKSNANPKFDYFSGNECLEKCNKVSNTYYEALKKGDCLKISWYSSTNAHEFFAEVFSYREMGNTLPDYINQMIDEVLK